MENLSPQPQYFRLNDTPPSAPDPWFRRPEVLKRLGMGFVALIAVIFVGVFVRNVFLTMTSGTKTALEAAQQESAQRQADCDSADTECKANAQTDVAREAGIVAACSGLSDAFLENCVTLLARDKKDTSSCDDLSGDAQARCADAVLLLRAQNGEAISICDGVKDSGKQNSCRALVASYAKSKGDCASYGVEQSICDDDKIIKDLLASGNFAGCGELAQEQRENCIEMFSVRDADADGLTAKRESELGTSDQRADTDGDGYSDSVEVAAGYNPLK